MSSHEQLGHVAWKPMLKPGHLPDFGSGTQNAGTLVLTPDAKIRIFEDADLQAKQIRCLFSCFRKLVNAPVGSLGSSAASGRSLRKTSRCLNAILPWGPIFVTFVAHISCWCLAEQPYPIPPHQVSEIFHAHWLAGTMEDQHIYHIRPVIRCQRCSENIRTSS